MGKYKQIIQNDDLKIYTFDPKQIIISHKGQQSRHNNIIIMVK